MHDARRVAPTVPLTLGSAQIAGCMRYRALEQVVWFRRAMPSDLLTGHLLVENGSNGEEAPTHRGLGFDALRTVHSGRIVQFGACSRDCRTSGESLLQPSSITCPPSSIVNQPPDDVPDIVEFERLRENRGPHALEEGPLGLVQDVAGDEGEAPSESGVAALQLAK